MFWSNRYFLSLISGSNGSTTHPVFLHKTLVPEVTEGVGENVESGRLSRQRVPDHHQPMTQLDHVIDLGQIKTKVKLTLLLGEYQSSLIYHHMTYTNTNTFISRKFKIKVKIQHDMNKTYAHIMLRKFKA